ncbi:MAG TPA: glycogen/starch/alpha-glucan phosphorylase, partial [Albitalea sp.]
AERIFPAAELSEQISTAGTEASGTGNMKFALNGALTIGTMDGANIEIRDAVGAESIFIFGHKAHEIVALNQGGYQPLRLYESNPRLAAVLDAVSGGRFSPDEPDRYRGVVDALLWGGDYYKLLADYDGYVAAQAAVDALYRDPGAWARHAIANVSGMGVFSSDRAIRTYATQIWHVEPLK